jgi:Mn-containing catalase
VYLHTQLLINEILPDEPDPAAANALQEGLGGQFGEIRTMMQYLFQSMNLRGDASSRSSARERVRQGAGDTRGQLGRRTADPEDQC